MSGVQNEWPPGLKQKVGIREGSGEEGKADVTVGGHHQEVTSMMRGGGFTVALSNPDGFERPSKAMPSFTGVGETW